eukprot:2960095-Ditylum_brightwellii.AAC.1
MAPYLASDNSSSGDNDSIPALILQAPSTSSLSQLQSLANNQDCPDINIDAPAQENSSPSPRPQANQENNATEELH